MGTATTPTILRLLVVPDPRFRWDAYDSTQSTVTQAGPQPGIPEAQNETEMVLETTGTQAADTRLKIKTVRGGHPDLDAARFVWQFQGDSGSQWRGWDPPTSISGFEFIDYSTTAGMWHNFHARVHPDGTVVVAADQQHRYVKAWARNASTGGWSQVTVYDRGSAQTYSSWPCLVVLPSGRMLCFFWAESTAGTYQVRNYYSDDSGASWTPAQKGCLPAGVATATYHPGMIRGDYLNGQIMLVIHQQEQATPEDRLLQYASNDLGATFSLVVEWSGKSHAWVDVVAYRGRLLVAYIAEDDAVPGQHYAYLRTTAAAFSPFTASEVVLMQASADPMLWGQLAGGVYTAGEITLWSDEDGILYVMGSDHDAAGGALREFYVRASYDGGASWQAVGHGTASAPGYGIACWAGLDAATHPRNVAAVAFRGRTLVLHRANAAPSTLDDSMMATWLGGYTTVCLPQEEDGTVGIDTVSGWRLTYLPYDLPEDTGASWSPVTAGAPVNSLTSTGLRVLHGNVADTSSWYTNPTASLTNGTLTLTEFHVAGGGSVFVDSRISDGGGPATSYSTRVTVTGTAITLRDTTAPAADIATVATTDGATGVQVLISMVGNNVIAWYRPVQTGNDDRLWTLIGSSGALNAGVVATALYQWGTLTGSATADAHFIMACLVDSTLTGAQIYAQDNWTDLLGRGYQPTPVYVDGGTSIQAVDGPTFRSDDWQIDTRYDYPLSNVFPDVAGSPRRGWRSTSDGIVAEIAWSTGAGVSPAMGSLMNLYLGECNFGTAELHGRQAGGGWVKICDLDLRAKTGLKFAREDRVVSVDTSGGNSVGYYLPTNILAGSHIRLSGGGMDVVREIETNSAGTWTNGGTSLPTRILLSEIPGGEPTAGSAAELWVKDYTCTVAVTTSYKAYKLKILAQSTAEGYYTIGSMTWGHGFPVGSYLMGYGWGRKLEWATSWEQVEGRSGIRTVHALGPTRRAVEVSWVDGIESSGLTDTSPNWIVGWIAGNPVAVPADLPWSLPGLLEHIEGGTLPVVYLSSVATPSNVNTPVHTTNRTTMLYGRVVSESVQADVVVGEEASTELLRVGVCRIEEEV